MANTLSPSTGSSDVISTSMTHIAMSASKQRRLLFAGVVILLATTLAASLYLTKRNAFRLEASEALFKARKTLETELTAYSATLAKPLPKKADAKKAEPAPAAPSLDFLRFDVGSHLPGAVVALSDVAQTYPNTLAGFDAKMELGSIYFDHGGGVDAYEKARQWFESAANQAPSKEHSVAALYNLGYAEEALGHCADAIKTFERGINSGAGPLLGELLRGKARCQTLLGDSAGAKTTYESIEKRLPGTEHARFAETKKASL